MGERGKEILTIRPNCRAGLNLMENTIMLRRNFLKSGLLGLGAVYGTGNVWASDKPNENDASVIYIFLNGGASHIELFNPIPDAGVEFRGIHGAIQTRSGYHIGADLPELAKISDKLTVVRSFHHSDANHQSAQGWVNTQTKHVPNQGQSWPAYGAVVSHETGTSAKNGVPHYVKVNKIESGEASFLGVKYAGYDSDEQGIRNLRPNSSYETFDRRIKILKKVDDAANLGHMGSNWRQLKDQAVEIVRGEASKAFDLSLEPEKNQIMYGSGKSRFGKDLMLARRVIEAGSNFAVVSTGGFDTHSNMDSSLSTLLPNLDLYLSILIKDLEDRGMNTLVVLTSEFGRTYKLNLQGGRDHFPSCNTLMFAGGGYNHGQLIGKTDAKASLVTDSEFFPRDLGRTILNHFGIKKKTVVDHSGRPRFMVEDGAKNILNG
jgi:hypothetical protein